MTTTKELIEFLKKFPEDTVVEILSAEECGSYESYTSVNFENLDLTNDEHFEFTDWTKNSIVNKDKDHSLYNLKTLELGIDKS